MSDSKPHPNPPAFIAAKLEILGHRLHKWLKETANFRICTRFASAVSSPHCKELCSARLRCHLRLKPEKCGDQ